MRRINNTIYDHRLTIATAFATLIEAAFRYSLPVLKIYSVRNVHYRFSVPTVNIGTLPESEADVPWRGNP